QRTSRGADQVQGWLFIAKQRALRDGAPRGIRLIRDTDNPNWVKELMYIERPLDLTFGGPNPGQLFVPSPALDNTSQNPQVFLPTTNLASGDLVLAGGCVVMGTAAKPPPY